MTMTVTGKTGPEAAASAIKAAKALHEKYVAAGDEKAAKLVAQVSNLFANVTFAEAKAEVPAKTADATAQIDGAEVDISDMADADAEDYLQYTREMDGSAARERHVARLEREDEEMREIGRHGG